MDLSKLDKVDKRALGVIEGRIVHVVERSTFGNAPHYCRPAIITDAWLQQTAYEHGEVNLTVFTDWTNDPQDRRPDISTPRIPLQWRTSIPRDGGWEPFADTWHFTDECPHLDPAQRRRGARRG